MRITPRQHVNSTATSRPHHGHIPACYKALRVQKSGPRHVGRKRYRVWTKALPRPEIGPKQVGRKRYRVQKSGQSRLDESATASRNRAKTGWTKALPRPEIGPKQVGRKHCAEGSVKRELWLPPLGRYVRRCRSRCAAASTLTWRHQAYRPPRPKITQQFPKWGGSFRAAPPWLWRPGPVWVWPGP